MTTVELFPADIHNQKTVHQGHPSGWINREGGEYDLVVLGGGPAGLVAAMTAAAGGYRVAMTEQRLTGGTCVNFGCTPSKALIRCARAVHDAGRGVEFGFRLDGPPRADFGAVMERVRRMRARSSAADAVQVVEQAGVEGLFRAHPLHRAGRLGGRRPPVAVRQGDDRHRIGPIDASHRRAADGRVTDQRERLLPDRAAGKAGRHRRRSARMRAGTGVPPPRQRGGPGQRHGAPAAP